MEKKSDNAGGFSGEKYPESAVIVDQEKAAVDCFYEKLGKLNESSGLSSVFNFREALLDLHLFYKKVIKRGGFYQVTKVGKWDDVASASNLKSSVSISRSSASECFLNSGFGPSCSSGKRKHCECSSPFTTVHSGDPAPADIWKPTNNSCLVAAGAKTMQQNSSMITLSNSNTKELSPDPDAPLKPRSGYQIFLRLETHRLKMIHGESSSSQNLRDMAIDAWRCLSEKDKQPYVEASKMDKERYEKELATYNQLKSNKIPKSQSLFSNSTPSMLNFSTSSETDDVYHVSLESDCENFLSPDESMVELAIEVMKNAESSDSIFQIDWESGSLDISY
ncbi:UNVERIFIED_CONTAM: hypothetical protein Sangu_0583500 [Sesamum angustifolium]|uniref:HMG box domain-containing protein n=1 Tax=Sesamum angustifolium TaxID=2727405 RepID=A0AAW2QAQ7_9LAMI